MTDLSDQLSDLVVANRILAHEGVVDGYGHVSIRHPDRPDRFFLSRSRSPELVTLDDLMEFDLECNPIDQQNRMMYAERAIHGAIYSTRPDVNSVVHNHAYEVIPFTLTPVKLRPVLHMAGGIGRLSRHGYGPTCVTTAPSAGVIRQRRCSASPAIATASIPSAT